MTLGSLLLAAALLASTPPPRGPLQAHLYVEQDGVVRVTEAELARAGFAVDEASIDRLRLRLQGKGVPALLQRLGAGSPEGRFALSFLGRHARGERTWQSEYGPRNVYVLDAAPPGEAPARITLEPSRRVRPGPPREASPYRSHQEVDQRLVRFSGGVVPDETWFWAELKAIDPEPTRLSLEVDRVAPGADFTLRVRFLGTSSLPENPDHTVLIEWNGQAVGEAVWDGEEPYVFEARLDGALLRDGLNELRLSVPGTRTNGIDLLLLDWVELDYSRAHRLGPAGQVALDADAQSAAVVAEVGAGTLLAFDRARPRAFSFGGDSGLALPEGSGTFDVVRPGQGAPPARITSSRPADLHALARADFVIVTHPRLQPAAERLAAARRREGLATAVVSVEDVFDAFGSGFARPEAIQAFLTYTWKTWTPRPRYVLLMGDASWDYKNTVVTDALYDDWDWQDTRGPSLPRNESTPYRPGELKNDRQLVPTVQWQSPWGHAASDNAFAHLQDGGDHPDLAVGRFPVATLEEAMAIVDKTLGAEKAPAGAGPPSALFITDDDPRRQRETEELAQAAEADGFRAERVYPRAEEKDNAENTARLLQAFDAGQSLVVFSGHGGRYIWRTGPPDRRKDHDLFTIDHLDQIREGTALPVVVSLTCYSAPFDHPTADSIGEKLLRLPGKGALAVIAASWRNAPPLSYGRDIMAALSKGVRVGDAFLAAMQAVNSTVVRNTYNLLGDPTAHFVVNNGALARRPLESPRSERSERR